MYLTATCASEIFSCMAGRQAVFPLHCILAVAMKGRADGCAPLPTPHLSNNTQYSCHLAFLWPILFWYYSPAINAR